MKKKNKSENGIQNHYFGMDCLWKTIDYFCFLCQDRFLAYPPDQHPIVLQIGGSNLENLAKATKLADAYGYDEINFKLVCFLQS